MALATHTDSPQQMLRIAIDKSRKAQEAAEEAGEELRQAIKIAVGVGAMSVAEVSAATGLSRPTVYAWLNA